MQQVVRPAALALAGASADPAAPVLRTVADLDGIAAVAEAWRVLDERFGDDLSFFQSHDWCRAWLETFATPESGIRPVVHTLWRSGRLIAVWPLMATAGAGGMTRLETLGEPHSQYSGMVCDPAEMDAAAISALAAAVPARGACDVAVFMAVPAGSPLDRVLAALPPLPGYANEASILDLAPYGSAADYTGQLGKLQRRNRNRRRNHLARLGALSFDVIWPDHPDFAPLARRCAGMKRVWLERSGRYSVGLSIDGHDAFLARLPGSSQRKRGACLSVLRVGDRVAALELGFVHKRHYYAWLGGFDWELRRHSPGKVQMDMTVAWLIDHGIAAYDLLGNPDDYKSSWSNHAVRLAAYARPFTLRGRLFAGLWLPVLRPAAKRVYNGAPRLLRRLANGLHGLCLIALYV